MFSLCYRWETEALAGARLPQAHTATVQAEPASDGRGTPEHTQPTCSPVPSRAARGEGAAGGSKGSSGRAAQGPVLVGGSETCVAPRGLPAARPAGSWAADQVSTGQDPAHQAVRPRWTEQGTWDPRPHAWIPSQKPPRVIRARSRRMTPKTRDFRTWLSASVGEPTARGPGTGRPEEVRLGGGV